MYKNNKTIFASSLRAFLAAMMLVILSGVGASAQTDMRITDVNPMAMPQPGAYGLRVLTPTMLELTLISTKAKDGAVTNWNFVSGGSLSAPAASEFQVTVGTQTVGVQLVGFKRRPLYAPLNTRDLRIGNSIYLQLNSAITDGQVVTVKNASGRLWGSDKNYTTAADPLRFNPAIHVNGEGYMPNYVKKAMVGYYLGSMGEMTVPSGAGFRIIDVNSGSVVHTGVLTSRKDVGYSYSPTPYQLVYEADFTGFKTPGEYRVQVPGMGASFAFMINEGVAGTFARGYALGLYHQRCGHANDYPHSRHQKGACHAKPVLVPDMTFAAVNSTLANVTGDYASSQSGAPQLKDVNSSLYPFVNKTAFDATGGHHDAGDYSKYTINVAQLANSLVFAADSHSGAGQLDNLGTPESGDGISDVLQIAKWELDFLAKLQDADGGFYFLVYPKDRRYEDTASLVGTDLGDTQVVFPKTTAATAASVAALAQAASSPKFKAAYPAVAAEYLAKAKKGWAFLETAWAKYGRDGAYQKITHYGNEFRDRDEIAWAACELYLATGEAKYHTELTGSFDPADPETRRWTWWRMFEGYGAAIRSYSFAVRSGRLPAGSLNAAFLAKCDAEIVAAGDDQVKYVKDSAYANPFPTWNKPFRSAGWFMSVEQTFDVATAYQLSAKPDYIEALIGAMNYEAGCNPLNMGFLTGVGWKRQRETVNQYANNDRRVLPPSGIPIGSVWPGAPSIWQYGSELTSLVYPTDSTTANDMFAPYEKWTDTFHVATEMVNPQQARGLGATAWLMAQTAIKSQVWKAATATITGLPASVPAGQKVTIGLFSSAVDLNQATIVWEARDQDPTPAQNFTFAAKNTGPQWVEAEALLPDGRRVFAKADFNATTATDTAPNLTQSAPVSVSPDVVALYHLDNNLTDAAGKQGALANAANAAFDDSNLGWMATRVGANLHFLDLGDQATVAIPYADTWAADTQGIIVEAMIYVNQFKGYNKANATLISLERNWNAFMELREDMYGGPVLRLGNTTTINSAQVKPALTSNEWHHIRMSIDKTGYTVKIDGQTVGSVANSELVNWNVSGPATLKFGNFDGWIDEVVVRHVRTSYPDGGDTTPVNTPPTIALTSPTSGASFTAGNSITLNATASDSNGSVTKVEFYQGSTKLGEDTTSPYSFTWSAVPAGSYNITARAIDNAAASTTSGTATVSVTTAPVTVDAPGISPNGGSFADSVAVSLATSTAGATIRYTVDGSTPTTSSTAYSAPINLTSSSTVRAIAVLNGTSSSATSASFTVTATPPDDGTVTGTLAKFVTTDTTSAGNWKGVYGKEGFNVVSDTTQYPNGLQVTPTGKSDWVWAWSTTDTRGLLKASSTDRILALWYSATSFTVDVSVTDAKAHRMSAYFVDWDNLGRSQTVEVIDAVTGAVLDTQTVSGFTSGKYLSWDIAGKVRLRITRTGPSNAILNGLFFDPAATVTQPPVNQAPTVALSSNGSSFVAGANVTLSATASDADGSVAKVEFFHGATKLGETTSAPYTFTWNNVSVGDYSITAKATDNTGASTTSSPISINVTAPAVVIAAPVISPNGGTFTNSVTVSFSTSTTGATIRYTTDSSTPTAVSTAYTAPISIVSSKTIKAVAFLNGASSAVTTASLTVVSGPVVSGSSAKYVRTDLKTRGNWKGVYGSEAYTVIGNGSKPLSFGTMTVTGKQDWTWAGSTADVDGLLKVASSTDRLASSWFSAASFELNINITDGKSHRLALYSCDWDQAGRSQTVEIINASTGALLNRQIVSSFASGRYTVWEIKGNVRVRITRTGGPNAAVNGIFFDAVPLQTL